MSEERQAKRLKTAPTSAAEKSVEIPGVKDLASSDPTIRRNCLQIVLKHLDTRPAAAYLTKTQSLQLWRGFYVALYMHDSKNMVSVQNLISTLASTFKTIVSKDEELLQTKSTTDSGGDRGGSSATDSESGETRGKWLQVWSEAFWETISREWSGIDSHRLNKYLLLVRVVVRQVFAICVEAIVKKELSSDPIESQTHILESWPLSPRERKVPDGLRLHMLDIWLDEMDTSGFSKLPEDNEEQKFAVLNGLDKLMDPVRRMTKDALNKGVRMRAKETLKAYEEQLLEDEKGDEVQRA